jgi:uroporphyrinogen decarboxylase
MTDIDRSVLQKMNVRAQRPCMKTEDKLLIRALNGETLPTPPVWLMRQAGRYLPEYRELREKANGFLNLCYTPEYAVEATMQPIRRFGFDASILFSDILVVPHAMGRNVWFEPGEGPRLDPMAIGDAPPAFDHDAFHAHLAPVYEAVKGLRQSLPAETALIGFSGAPWTLATYMAAGRGKDEQDAARRWMFTDPDGFAALIDGLADAIASYLIRQIDAGAEAVQIFDSWASALAPNAFDRYCIAPTKKIVDTVRAAHPTTPIMGFPRGVGASYEQFMVETGVTGVSLDQGVSPDWAAKALQPHGAVQGNLEPMHMITGGDPMKRDVDRIRAALGDGPFVLNLGHGITPQADPANVEALLRHVRG